jgi:hypothetical protein
MLNKVAEPKLHIFRYILAIGWLVLIVSLFYDPISAPLTDPASAFFSPFKDSLIEAAKDPSTCIRVQGKCLTESPYPMGTRIFWGMIVPSAIALVFILGHETWRRICPLYFLSQIPRKLGLNPKLDIRKNQWLTQNHLFLQFGLFFLGLNMRILFINSARPVFGTFLLFTIVSAMTIVFLYGGRSWCHYVCPFGIVQMVFTGPRSLLGSQAHIQPKGVPTQSMCRTHNPTNNTDTRNCVGCKSPCMDIDAEKAYWEQLNKPGRKLVQYGYLGLVFSYFIYYYLYSGNFKYYFSGAWSHEADPLGNLFKPGLYLGGHAIGIPKLIASPLILGLITGIFYLVWLQIEKAYFNFAKQRNPNVDRDIIVHHVFSIVTFLSFLGFYVYGGRPEILRLPFAVQTIFNGLVVLVATLWLNRTWGRNFKQYKKEGIADTLRRQLQKLNLNFTQILQGRTLEDLKPDELDLLAQVLPQITKQDRLKVYKGVLKELLQAGQVEPIKSLKSLQQVRQQLQVTEEEHDVILNEIGIEDSTLIRSTKESGQEDRLRLQSYRDEIANLLQQLVDSGIPLQDAISRKTQQIANLKAEYKITPEENDQVLDGLFNALRPKAEKLLALLQVEGARYQAITNVTNYSQTPVFILLRKLLLAKQELIVTPLLAVLEMLGNDRDAIELAQRTGINAKDAIEAVLQDPEARWKQRLNPALLEQLQVNDVQATTFYGGQNTLLANEEISSEAAEDTLLQLLQEPNPITQSASLYALTQFNRAKGLAKAQEIMAQPLLNDLVRDTAAHILGQSHKPTSIVEQIINLSTQAGLSSMSFQELLSVVNQAQRENLDVTEIRPRIDNN